MSDCQARSAFLPRKRTKSASIHASATRSWQRRDLFLPPPGHGARYEFNEYPIASAYANDRFAPELVTTGWRTRSGFASTSSGENPIDRVPPTGGNYYVPAWNAERLIRRLRPSVNKYHKESA